MMDMSHKASFGCWKMNYKFIDFKMAKRTLQASLLCAIIVYSLASSSYENDVESQQTTAYQDSMQQLFEIEGKVSVIDDKLQNDWISDTRVLVNGGEYVGFIKSDGSFTVNLIPSGSHLVEVSSPNYFFDKFRVDITKGGKFRARKADFIQPNSVHVVAYPLRFMVNGQAAFFEARETWKATDVLFNPMVIMMVLPLLFLFVMPKLLANADPDTQKEMQSSMNVFQNQREMPEVSEYFARWFSNPKKKTGGEKAITGKSGRRR